jgi:hypothetical protein
VSATYREKFPNPSSRCQFVRGFLTVIAGMTNEEFEEQYKGFTREDVVIMLRRLISEANKEIKEKRLQTHLKT